MMKKWTAISLLIVMILSMFTACKSSKQEEDASLDAVAQSEQQDEAGQETIETEEPQNGAEQEEATQEDASAGETKQEEQPAAESASKEEPSVKEEPEQEQTVITPSAEEALANLYENGNTNTAIGLDGKNAKSQSYSVSKLITVKAGDSVTFGPTSSAQVVQGYAYDTAGKPLELMNARNLTETATFTYGMKIYTYQVPAGAAGVKVNVANSAKSDFVIARNNAFDLTGYRSLTGKSADFIDDVLEGRRGLFVGDSICYGSQDTAVDGERGWARRIAAETGLIATNNGKSGASVSDAREVTNRGGTVLTKLLEKKGQSYDYVVLHGGVNDAWDHVEVGTMSEEYDPAFFDTTTFAGGLETLIYNAILCYGEQAAIGYLINFKAPLCTKGTVSDMSAYNAVAKKICDKWGITYFDMYDNAEITAALKFDTQTYTNDYIHPLSSGYDVLSPYIAEYMRTMTPCSAEMLEKVLNG